MDAQSGLVLQRAGRGTGKLLTLSQVLSLTSGLGCARPDRDAGSRPRNAQR
jgi:hypothetical protein